MEKPSIHKTCPVCGRDKLKLVWTSYGARLPRHHEARVKSIGGKPRTYISATVCEGGGEPLFLSDEEKARASQEESTPGR